MREGSGYPKTKFTYDEYILFSMYNCVKCGKDISLQYENVCCLCRQTFCSEHKFAENHRCLHLPYVLGIKERQMSNVRSRKQTSHIIFCIFILLISLIAYTSSAYNKELKDPTYYEALQFIRTDQIDKCQYSNEYTCVNFAKDFMKNALEAGYRCGYVIIYFPATGHLEKLIDRPNSITNWSHALNCFNTTDYGFIFVEPQTDEIVELTCGKPYWDRTKYLPAYNDTINEFQVFW